MTPHPAPPNAPCPLPAALADLFSAALACSRILTAALALADPCAQRAAALAQALTLNTLALSHELNRVAQLAHANPDADRHFQAAYDALAALSPETPETP